jgi:hypothetical protein
MTGALSWYSVRCVFDHGHSADTDLVSYEERITLWQAASLDEAIELAEAEAIEYASTLDSRYMGLAQAYWLSDEPVHGEEIFSLTRDSNSAGSDYLNAFFDTGAERQQRSEPGP